MFADNTTCADADSDLYTLVNMANIELKKIASWFRANKMMVTISTLDMDDKEIVYDDNDPFGVDPHLIVPLECYHNNHIKLTNY
jgi:hypothetical protein